MKQPRITISTYNSMLDLAIKKMDRKEIKRLYNKRSEDTDDDNATDEDWDLYEVLLDRANEILHER